MSPQVLLLFCLSLSFYSKISSSFFIYSFFPSFLLFFHLFQLLSNFFKYSSSNFLLSHPYNNFAIYFPGNSPLLNSSASRFNFISFPFFILILHISSSNLSFSNSSTFSIAFFKFSNPSYVFSSTVYPFHFTKYFVFPLLSCLSLLHIPSHQLPQQEAVVSSSVLLLALYTSLFFSH